MKDKKRKHPKSPEHIGKANKGPKKSDSSISGYLVTNTQGDITYTPANTTAASTYASTYANTWLGGSDLPPESPKPSLTESAKQKAPIKPLSKITPADIAPIPSWKPRPKQKASPPSNPQPASQESESPEGTNKNTEKPRNKESSLEPKLDNLPLPMPPMPVPTASKHEETSSKEACLIPITPPMHVEHVHTSPLS